jgi:hypothetical protein
LKSDGDILFLRIKNVALQNPQRDEEFKDLVREQIPGSEFHHVFTSTVGMKSTDLLGVAVRPEDHNENQTNRDWLIEKIPGAIRNLIMYVIKLKKEIIQFKKELRDERNKKSVG